MKVSLSDIFHLERFSLEGEEFIKDTHNPSLGNVIRRSGKKDYVFLPPETIVQRKEPDIRLTIDQGRVYEEVVPGIQVHRRDLEDTHDINI